MEKAAALARRFQREALPIGTLLRGATSAPGESCSAAPPQTWL